VPKVTNYQDTGMGGGAYPILDNTMEQLKVHRRNSIASKPYNSKHSMKSGSHQNSYPILDNTMELNFRDTREEHPKVNMFGESPAVERE
jgi:hypothetical protein